MNTTQAAAVALDPFWFEVGMVLSIVAAAVVIVAGVFYLAKCFPNSPLFNKGKPRTPHN